VGSGEKQRKKSGKRWGFGGERWEEENLKNINIANSASMIAFSSGSGSLSVSVSSFFKITGRIRIESTATKADIDPDSDPDPDFRKRLREIV
jgi:hypothetical protein